MIHSRPTSVLKALPQGRIEGLAWAFSSTPDPQGDAILPSALVEAAKAAPWPLMIDHAGPVVGEVEEAEVTDEGLMIAGRMDLGATAGAQAYQRAKSGELGGLSIAFQGMAEKSGPLRIFSSVSLREVSMTARPVNVGSRVTSVKSWSEVQSPVDLERLLRSSGMPNRLAARVAAAAWPAIQKSEPEPENPELQAALRRLARI